MTMLYKTLKTYIKDTWKSHPPSILFLGCCSTSLFKGQQTLLQGQTYRRVPRGWEQCARLAEPAHEPLSAGTTVTLRPWASGWDCLLPWGAELTPCDSEIAHSDRNKCPREGNIWKLIWKKTTVNYLAFSSF